MMGINKMFDINMVQVELRDDGDYVIKWQTMTPALPVTVYSGTSATDIDFNTPLATTSGLGVNISGLNGCFRRYFYLQAQTREGVLAGERRLPFIGTKNFRDLGGYQGAECMAPSNLRPTVGAGPGSDGPAAEDAVV